MMNIQEKEKIHSIFNWAWSYPVGAPEEGIRRCVLSPEKLVERPADGISTVYDVLRYAAEEYGPRNALGWREQQAGIIDKGNYSQLSNDYRYMTFSEFNLAVGEVARGLHILGIGVDDVFNLFAATSPNWQLISHACASISVTIATAYETLGESGLIHSLSEPGCVGVFTDAELLPTLFKTLFRTPTIKLVIYGGEVDPSLITSFHRDVNPLTIVLSVDKLRKIGTRRGDKNEVTKQLEARRPSPDSVACIMYTSGSTGDPKGVVIRHRNLVASLGGLHVLLGHHLTATGLDSAGDSYLAYLPLAHILEYLVELFMLYSGVTVGYGHPKTLIRIANSSQSRGDIAAFRPTIMAGVPAVWEMIRKSILSAVNGGTFGNTFFTWAMYLGEHDVPVLARLADAFVLRPVVSAALKAGTGLRLRYGMNGGAALSGLTREFLNSALVPIMQGYGLTESCGVCATVPPELLRNPSFPDPGVGLIVPSVEVKLRPIDDDEDIQDSSLLSSGCDISTMIEVGEICIHGPSVSGEYFKRSDLNEDESIFTTSGGRRWLRTGDIGRWNADGTLSVIGRIKNLVKSQDGEYVSLDALESAYRSCDLVNDVCVCFVKDARQPVAIIVPHEVRLRQVLASFPAFSSNSQSLESLCQDDRARQIVLEECNNAVAAEATKQARRKGPRRAEVLLSVVLTPEVWTPENGLVTTSRKVRRRKIAEQFEVEINDAYASGGKDGKQKRQPMFEEDNRKELPSLGLSHVFLNAVATLGLLCFILWLWFYR